MQDIPGELWLPIVDWLGWYEVSNKGRIRSVDRWVSYRNGRRRFFHGCIIQQGALKAGYLQVHLAQAGKVVTCLVHRLVLEAFAGPPKPGEESLHGPGGNQDNRYPENLRWGTTAENAADRVEAGGYAKGSAVHNSKLTDAIVIAARQRVANGETSTELAREFGVSLTTMHQAVCGKTWRHLPEPFGGGLMKGSGHYAAKLTEATVLVARQRVQSGEQITVLAKEFGVSLSTMAEAVRGKTWRHVPLAQLDVNRHAV